MSKSDLYLVSLSLVVILLAGLNEVGFGALAFLLLTLLAVWLMSKAFE